MLPPFPLFPSKEFPYISSQHLKSERVAYIHAEAHAMRSPPAHAMYTYVQRLEI